MLTENNKLEDKEDRILCVIKGWCAYDPITKAGLMRSNGCHKAGQRCSYYVFWDNHELKRIKAFTDTEAIEKATSHIAKRLQDEAEWQAEAVADNNSYYYPGSGPGPTVN